MILIIFILTGLFIVACIYYACHKDCEYHDHKMFAVTIPEHKIQDPEVRDIKERYHKEMHKAVLISILLLLPIVVLVKSIVVMLYYFIWMFVMFKIMFTPFAHANEAMKECKKRQNWVSYESTLTHIDTSIAQHLHDAMLKPYVFGIPLLMDTFSFLFMKDKEVLTGMVILLNVVLMVVGYWFILRIPNRTYCDDSNLNIALNRNRKYHYSLFLFLLVLENSTINMFLSGMAWIKWEYLPLLIIIESCFLLLFLLLIFFSIRQMRRQETAYMKAIETPYYTADEDDFWHVGALGLYYNNPYDNSFMKTTPSGMQITFNMAKPIVRIVIWIFCVALFAFLFGLFGYPYYLSKTGQLVDVSIQHDSVVIDSPFYSKEIAIEDIQKVTLLNKKIEGVRTMGTDTGSYAKGKYRMEEYGDCTLYVASGYQPYILVKTNSDTYIFNDDDSENTKAVYNRIKKHIEGRDIT